MSDFLAFVVQHAEIVLFLYVLADQLGVPFRAAPILLAAGGLAAAGRLSLPGAVGLGVPASLVADLVWYTVGGLRGRQVLGLLCRVSLEPDTCVRWTENVFLRHGVPFLLFAKFVPGLGTVGPPLAGIVRVGVLRFAIYSAAGAFLWAGAWMAPGVRRRPGGRTRGHPRWSARRDLRRGAAAVIVGYVVLKWIRRRLALSQGRVQVRGCRDRHKGPSRPFPSPGAMALLTTFSAHCRPYTLPTRAWERTG